MQAIPNDRITVTTSYISCEPCNRLMEQDRKAHRAEETKQKVAV